MNEAKVVYNQILYRLKPDRIAAIFNVRFIALNHDHIISDFTPMPTSPTSNTNEDYRDQYERFIEEVIELEVVWNLQSDEGFAICESDEFDDKQVMPFWSREKDAKIACSEDWAGYYPNPIRFDDFVDAWLHGMHDDEIYVGINWSEALEGVEIEPVILIEDLLAEE